MLRLHEMAPQICALRVGARLVTRTGEDIVRTSRLTFGAVAAVASLIVTGVVRIACQVVGAPIEAPIQLAVCLGVAGGVMWLGDAMGLMQASRAPIVSSLLPGRARK